MQQPPKVILLLPSAREFDRGLRRGIFKYAHDYGPWIFGEVPPPYLKQLTTSQRKRQFRKWNADGAIALEDRLPEVGPLRVPTIAVNARRQLDRTHCQLVSDDDAIGQMGAKTILDLGIRQAAYCGLPNQEFSSYSRSAPSSGSACAASSSNSVQPIPGKTSLHKPSMPCVVEARRGRPTQPT